MQSNMTISQLLSECEQRHRDQCAHDGKGEDYCETEHSRVARYLRHEITALQDELIEAAEKAVNAMECAADTTDSDVVAQDLYDASDALKLALDGERAANGQ